jgi:hypothetical protein
MRGITVILAEKDRLKREAEELRRQVAQLEAEKARQVMFSSSFPPLPSPYLFLIILTNRRIWNAKERLTFETRKWRLPYQRTFKSVKHTLLSFFIFIFCIYFYITSEVYYIYSAHDPKLVLDVASNNNTPYSPLIVFPFHGKANQQFLIQADGYVERGLCMDTMWQFP